MYLRLTYIFVLKDIQMVRVWINHWFSTAYRLIELMKQDDNENIYVLAIDSVIQKVCDEWYQESSAIGVRVMVDDYEIVKLLNDKVAAYNYLQECEGIHIPDYRLVNTADEFEEAYHELKNNNDQVCVKFACDEGAMSYRRIIDHVDRFKRLRIYQGAEVSYDDYIAALREAERFDDLMLDNCREKWHLQK